MQQHTKKLVLAALFAALTCAATMSVRIPIPGNMGYVHPGDALVILSGLALGPVFGALAAGIGSGLADLFSGFPIYIPISILIKGLIAFLVGKLCPLLPASGRLRCLRPVVGGILDIILVAGGYFLYESFLYGPGAAASVPANLIQGASGLILALLLYPVLLALPQLRGGALLEASRVKARHKKQDS